MRNSNGNNKEMLNIIVTGKSGAGKSSFLNYLIGEDHFKVGEGSPVTQTYFEDYSYVVPDTGVLYHLYDTKGIEPTTTSECRKVILDEIKKRDNLSIFEWVHTVYYCFDASAKRIQPFEINFINELKKYVSIVILLTKKDLVSGEDLNALISQIVKEINKEVQVIPICNVEQRTRKGVSHREGKEEALKASFLGLWEKLANTHPRKTIEPLLKECPINFIIDHQGFDPFDLVKDAIKDFLLKKSDRDIPEKEKEISLIINKVKSRKLSLDFLCNFPLIDELGGDSRGGQYVVVPLMKTVNDYITFLSRRIPRNINVIWDENEKLHHKVFTFYQIVNQVRPRVFYSDMAKRALQTIANYNISSKLAELSNLTKEINKRYEDVKNAWILDGDERIAVYDCFYKYRDIVMKIGIELNLLINNFLSIYQAELVQYGQYCLKKNLKKENLDNINSESELDNDEKTYYSIVQACLSNHLIEERERYMLEELMEVLEISPTRAGLIEVFARRILLIERT